MTAQTDLLDQFVLPAGHAILDVGCGDGWLVRRLAARGATVVGVDPGPDALSAARAAPTVSGERYLCAAAEALPLPDDGFDVLVFFNSLHHVPVDRIDDALAEALRVCRPGGLVFVQEPLAEGPFFELMRPVSDETAQRTAADDALRRAGRRRGVTASRQTFTPEVRMRNFEAWSEHHLLVDPARAAPLREAEAELRAGFATLGRRDGDGWCFAAPARVTLLRPGAG